LDEKEKELLKKLSEIEKYKKKELEIQKGDLKFGIESIMGSCQMIEHSLSLPHNDVQLLLMKSLYCARLDYLLNNKWKIAPRHHSSIELTVHEKQEQSIYSSISNIGIINSYTISPEKCLFFPQQRGFKNEVNIFEITTHSKEGDKLEKGGYAGLFEIDIKELAKENEKTVEGTLKNYEYGIQDLNNGKYHVTLKVKEKGTYSISVLCDGVSIPSSPFQIQMFSKEDARTYNGQFSPQYYFGVSSPYGIAVDSIGNIIVCDNGHYQVRIFNSDRQNISTFGSSGSGDGQFSNPRGVTTNSKREIIVCDYSNHRIQIFDSQGKFISKFGTNGSGDGQFSNPYGICVDASDNIYVCDEGNNQIQIFDPKGKFISKFGSYGSGNGQLYSPYGIAVNSKGEIIVLELNNSRIQVFNSKGQHISIFGNGQFSAPYAICVDLSDNILVCDYNNHRVQIFDPKGNYITQFGVNYPSGIAINYNLKSQNIFICELDNSRVSVY